MEHARSIYDNPRLAAGYAYNRPPVHPEIIRTVKDDLRIVDRLGRALDVGCGAGLSTAALAPLAATAVGLEPVRTMLAHRQVVAPGASFLVGRAERLPFSDEAFDLVTTAGAINYADRDLFLPEAARVLAPGGALVIYDFSAGRRFRRSTALGDWYDSFEHRYPSAPGYEMDVKGLPYGRYGLRLGAYKELEVAVVMNLDSYLRYALSETSVESAISRGVPEEEIRGWCQATLAGVFGGASREVLFDAYVAYVRRDSYTGAADGNGGGQILGGNFGAA